MGLIQKADLYYRFWQFWKIRR